ncbi:hypothetical protein ACET3Z_030925 [Daucus carota]
MGESNIISNILSMDFDSWDESLALPQNLVKLPGETDKQFGPLCATNMKIVQNSNQSSGANGYSTLSVQQPVDLASTLFHNSPNRKDVKEIQGMITWDSKEFLAFLARLCIQC